MTFGSGLTPIVGRKGKSSSSPNSSLHSNPAIPRVKLHLRSATPPTPLMLPQKRVVRRSMKAQPDKRDSRISSESSELTPIENDDDEEGQKKEEVTPKMVKKGKDKATSSHDVTHTQVNLGTQKQKTTTSGPGGRERKRVVKLGEVERRRARDEKFGVGIGDAYGSLIPIVQNSTRSIPANPYLNYESDDDHPPGLPEAFVGQDVEDLAYGANLAVEDHRMKSPRGGGSAWWSEEEDEEMLISQLSDSEVGQKSQSSVHNSDSDDPMTDTDDASSTNDELDGFGFPSHTASAFPSSVDVPSNSPLVLMENWDGQFILVQPRQGRSRSRPRGSRGSRMAGSIGESTVLSTLDQQGLIIDPDAAEYEFDEDSSSSLWSGMSDEGDGDTTDSMEEEDMPVLDSPALQGVLEQQMADITMGIAVNGSSGLDLQQATSFVEPSIVVTDISVPQTRALSTAPMSMSDTSTGLLAIPVIPAPPAPMMGTFHPTSDDPAQHAVIDGSKTTTKSPFTHRRRSRRDSLSSIVTGKERKRKSSSIEAFPFSPATPASSILPKRARYSSIPGHPRYVAARRAAEALDNDGETTPSEYETGAMVLEDMLEISMLGHEFEEANDPDFRFDRVPVSTYLRRNFHSSSGRRGQEMPAYPCMKSGSINDALAGPPGRMLVSPMLPPVVEGEEGMLSRKERRRKARRGRMAPLQI